ncbi:hypothetical protein [Rhodobacter sp. NSM]|uniref:hypothetical protein n=1 Tax=Rhodobacter sp. NSM TaxID=3457501 RepID=UPI003FD42117
MRRLLADIDTSQPSLYDGEVPEEDLWFAGPTPETEEAFVPPLPRADRRVPLRDVEWRRAEAALAANLARTAQRFGAFDERMRRAPAGVRERLAVREACEFSWWAGDRVTPDRLSLWMSLRMAGAQLDSLALSRAAWGARRLIGGPGPAAGLAAFLGRKDETDRVPDWAEVEEASAGLHAITRAAVGYHFWIAVAGDRSSGRIEAAVVASRVGASEGRSSAFLPLASGGSAAFRGGGTPEERLARWYEGADRATLALLRHLDSLEEWRERASIATAALSGRTPKRLVEALCRWPLLSAPVAESETGSSRAAVQRNFERLSALGLIREVTGQERFRLWTASLQR